MDELVDLIGTNDREYEWLHRCCHIGTLLLQDSAGWLPLDDRYRWQWTRHWIRDWIWFGQWSATGCGYLRLSRGAVFSTWPWFSLKQVCLKCCCICCCFALCWPFKCYVSFFSGNSTPIHPLVKLISLNRTSSYCFFGKSPWKYTPMYTSVYIGVWQVRCVTQRTCHVLVALADNYTCYICPMYGCSAP